MTVDIPVTDRVQRGVLKTIVFQENIIIKMRPHALFSTSKRLSSMDTNILCLKGLAKLETNLDGLRSFA